MDTKLLVEIVEELEWEGVVHGQGTGMGFDNGARYAACPTCGGTRDDVAEFREGYNKGGHKSGCKIALALGRPTLLPKGQQGKLAL